MNNVFSYKLALLFLIINSCAHGMLTTSKVLSCKNSQRAYATYSTEDKMAYYKQFCKTDLSQKKNIKPELKFYSDTHNKPEKIALPQEDKMAYYKQFTAKK